MFEVVGLSKRYGKMLANQDINMRVEPGELAVLLGPNGAGKSTLIKSICGLLRFEGRVEICGFENHSMEAKRVLGYVPEMPAMYPMLTVYEHIQFIAKAYQLDGWEPWADQLLARFELDDKRKKLGQELSKGMQQKLSICCAVLPRPRALILDEPMVGLDPHAIRELKVLIRELKEGGAAIIISTHMIDSMEENWDTTYIMKSGQILETRKRLEMSDEKLEDVYFSITENGGTPTV